MQESSESREVQLQSETLGWMTVWAAYDIDSLLREALVQTLVAMVRLPTESEAYEHLVAASQRIECASAIAELLLARCPGMPKGERPLDLNQIVQECREPFFAWSERPAELRLDLARDLPLICGDAYQMRQVVMNLLVNVTEMADANGESEPHAVQVKTHMKTVPPGVSESFLGGVSLASGRYVCLTVGDLTTRNGIDMVEQLFHPLSSMKMIGLGLGLSLLLKIVTECQGGMQLVRRAKEKIAFCICFPEAERRADEYRSGLRTHSPVLGQEGFDGQSFRARCARDLF